MALPPSVSPRPTPETAGAGAALLRHSSLEVRQAYERWRGSGDIAAAEAVAVAVVRDHIPDKARQKKLVLEDRLTLAGDLGFDSMAITETVFAFEDIFEVTIANAEILPLRTVGDLRAFVRRRLVPPAAAAAAPRP